MQRKWAACRQGQIDRAAVRADKLVAAVGGNVAGEGDIAITRLDSRITCQCDILHRNRAALTCQRHLPIDVANSDVAAIGNNREIGIVRNGDGDIL